MPEKHKDHRASVRFISGLRKGKGVLALIIVVIALDVAFHYLARGIWEILTGILAVLLVLFLIWLKCSKPGLDELEYKRDKIKGDMGAASEKFACKKMAEAAFKVFNMKKEKELLIVEAEIATRRVERSIDKIVKKQGAVLLPKRKYRLKELLSEKKTFLEEGKLAKRHYLKGKIDSASYKKLVSELQKKLTGIEAKINSLYKGEAKDILEDARRRLKFAEKEDAGASKERVARDIYEQIGEE